MGGKPPLLLKGVFYMARKKLDAEKLVTVQAAVPVVIWQANRPLTEQQHEELSRKLQSEQDRTGVKVMLVPNSVDVEIGIVMEERQQAAQLEDDQPAASGGADE
jgi:2,3-bisphosphoglycerate-independent phosphoglycerate mutase